MDGGRGEASNGDEEASLDLCWSGRRMSCEGKGEIEPTNGIPEL